MQAQSPKNDNPRLLSRLPRPCLQRLDWLSILSGILIGTSYIPFPPWAIFFCFVPLWLAWLKTDSYRTIFRTGWLTQFVLTLIGFNWVSYTVHEFGHLPWPAAIITLLLFCGFANLHVPLAGLAWLFFCRKLRLSSAARIWALPLFMMIGERAFPMIFDWHFGYTWLWAGFPAYQLASVIGFVGLSNIGLMFNALILKSYLQYRGRQPKWWSWAAAVPALFLALNLLGIWELSRLPKPDASLKALVVQANIGNEEKLLKEGIGGQHNFRDVIIERFFKLTEEGVTTLGRPDWIVWPETAYPELLESPKMYGPYDARLKSFIERVQAPIMTGSYGRLESNGKVTNAFFALGKTGEWAAPPYHKTVLLAFGEYLPLGETFPKLYDLLPQVGNFGRGPGPTVLSAENLRVGVQICYEGLFDWFTRRLGQQDAQILVNVTNDSWYGAWQQPYQHGYMTLARAIEVRRPLIRSTNTGISTVVLADGTVMTESPLHEPWFHLYEIPYLTEAPATAFMSWGYYLIPTLIALALIALMVFGRGNDQSRLG